jgi:hypothetical protein
MDDLYAGWTLTGAAARLPPGCSARWPRDARRLPPLRLGGRPLSRQPTPCPPEVLVVEGCGSSPRALDPVDDAADLGRGARRTLRLARGLARDGAALEPEWRRWQLTEAADFAAEGTRARADLLVDGAAVCSEARFAYVC